MNDLQPVETLADKAFRLIEAAVISDTIHLLDHLEVKGGVKAHAHYDKLTQRRSAGEIAFANGRIQLKRKDRKFGPQPVELTATFVLPDGKAFARFVIDNPVMAIRSNLVGNCIAEFVNVSAFPGRSVTKIAGIHAVRQEEPALRTFIERQIAAYQKRQQPVLA